jgi:lipopolysaccharide transport protein LptA
VSDARTGIRLGRSLALLGAAVFSLGLMTLPVAAQEAAPSPEDSMSASPPLATSVVPATGEGVEENKGTIGNSIRAEPVGVPSAAPPAPAPAPEDDLTGDTISVTGGVPGTTPTAPTTDTSGPPPPVASAPVAVHGAPAPDASLAPTASAAPMTPATGASPPAASAAALAPAAPQVSAPASTPVTTASVPGTGAIAPPMTLVAPSSEVVAPEPAAPPPDLPVIEDVARAKKSGAKTSDKSAGESNSKGTKVASNAPQEGAFTGGLQFGNSKSPIDIKSDSMSLEYQNHSVLWAGHVHANQANAQLTSDNLRVNYLDKDFKEMKDMVADGNVRVSQGTRWATGDHGVFDQIKRTVVLTGSPVVHDGTDQITGRRITVFLDTGKSVVEGAHAVIFPHQGQETSSSAPAGAADKQ